MTPLEEAARRFAHYDHALENAEGARAGELAIGSMAARHDIRLLADVPCGCDGGTCPGPIGAPQSGDIGGSRT